MKAAPADAFARHSSQRWITVRPRLRARRFSCSTLDSLSHRARISNLDAIGVGWAPGFEMWARLAVQGTDGFFGEGVGCREDVFDEPLGG